MAKETPHSQYGSSVFPIPPAVIQHHGQHHGQDHEQRHGLFSSMREWVRQKRMPPVLLLTGAAGIGKRTLGYFLAQWILCEKTGFSQTPDESLSLFGEAPAESGQPDPANPMPCGTCSSCARAVKGNWVDFLEITPENEDTETLKIDQFRELKAKAGFGAHEGAYRIILIPNADHMTVQAANSMLKLLEEPPADWLFILTASDPSLLLPTIVSRCQTLRLKPFTAESLQELLSHSDLSPDRARICAALAQGSWGKAWELGQNELWERRKSLFDFLRDPPAMLNPILEWATQSPRHFNFLVDQLELLTFDLIKWSLSAGQATQAPAAQKWLNEDAAAVLLSHAQRQLNTLGSLEEARTFWLERAERLARVRQESTAPLNRKILVQDLLLPWLQVNSRTAGSRV